MGYSFAWLLYGMRTRSIRNVYSSLFLSQRMLSCERVHPPFPIWGLFRYDQTSHWGESYQSHSRTSR
ncbi:hypothetical protein [Haladaptatus sp. W1]|uniref:hypothetical protein n=1 Tax=Haladaptatus sp. W1 TaxID=1897478 RepID=UPI0020C74CAD|nr:hypothetical protein [Haladaptatus sp. W1]